MKPRAILSLLPCATLALCCACGVPGAPQPPSLKLPKPVRDLRAERKGDKVTLTWTAPRVTTDQVGIKQLGVTRICRSLGTEPASGCAAVGEVAGAQTAPAKPASFVDTLPLELQESNPKGFVTYAVEAQNAEGRSAGLSNKVEVPVAPVPDPPNQVSARVTSQGVEVSAVGTVWVEADFHLFRRAEGSSTSVDLGTSAAISRVGANIHLQFLDESIEWEKKYSYHITPFVTTQQDGKQVRVEGEDSAAVEVLTHDTFPPAVPAGLEAVYTPVPQQAGFIDLTWAPDTEADLAGYNIYRHEEGAAQVKISGELVKTPAFRDRSVVTGHRYFYSVSAVDLRGNESEKSAEASEAVPQ